MADYLWRAFLAGSAVALAAGPLGSFVIWRRMAYYGTAVSHSALLGVALGLALHLDITIAVTTFCLFFALLLVVLRSLSALPQDSIIGLIAEVSLAGGLVAIGFLQGVRTDLLGYLFGDVLAVSSGDLIVIAAIGAVSLAALAFLWRPLLSSTLHPELAQVDGVNVKLVELAYMALIAIVVAAGMRIVGILLIVALLVIPPAAARRFSRTPEAMAAIAALIGVLSVSGGLWLSSAYDVEAGPAVVLVAGALFVLSLFAPMMRAR